MKKWIKNQKPELLLWVGSMLFLFIVGLLVSYNYEIKDNYNYLFDSDTARVIKDATIIKEDHYRVDVHPLFILLVQPVVHLISGVVLNKMLAIIILSSLVSSLSVVFLYKILNLIKPNKKINLLISLIYLFSFSNIIFTSGIETYNFATLFLIITWYYFIKKEQTKESYDKDSLMILVLLAILNFSFTMTNICIYLLIIFILWVMKKIKIPQITRIGVLSIGMILLLSLTQKIIWQTTPLIWDFRPSNEQEYVVGKFGKENIKEVVENDYYNSIISSSMNLKFNHGFIYNEKNIKNTFEPVNYLNFIMLSAFYIFLIILLARNFKKKLAINSGLVLSLLFNTVLHLIYGNDSTFLYSLHFVYLIILLLGINLHLEENKKFKNSSFQFLIVFCLIEMIINSKNVIQMIINESKVLIPNFFVANLGITKTIIFEIIMTAVVALLILLGIKWIKKSLKEHQLEKKIIKMTCAISILLCIELAFILVDSIEENKRFLKKEYTTPNITTSNNKSTFMSKEFNNYFKQEISKLNEYISEIDTFQLEYSIKKVSNKTKDDYYFFGLGNRKKILYTKGKLMNIEDKKVLMEFDVEESIIVPNDYSVLIRTKEDDFIKIKEDETGIHIIKNGKDEILEGTNIEINLYTFENQKYSNMKKVLYSEILFNIKDSAIYPNIIVYNHPWYRDTAITCMVLKNTNNTDLIREWVLNIEDIYDRQNSGVEEPDNLGELLYIISTQDEKNEELIQKIKDEAYRLAESNENGYYIYGQTDFGSQNLYQNLWYKFGLESIGETYPFDLESIEEDNYSKMAWWSNYEVKNRNNNLYSEEYPYLSYAARHKLKTGVIPVNVDFYPLSWETSASNADYSSYQGLEDFLMAVNTSPMHSWSASEFLLLLLDETGDLHK